MLISKSCSYYLLNYRLSSLINYLTNYLTNSLVIFFLILCNTNTSFAKSPAPDVSDNYIVENVTENKIVIKSISPKTVRYGKNTDIIINYKNNHERTSEKAAVLRAILSPGGPFISRSFNPGISAINDTLIFDNNIFIATQNGNVYWLQDKNQKTSKKIQLSTPILQLAHIQSQLFALTQDGYLVSIKLADFNNNKSKIKNKSKVGSHIIDIAANKTHLYLLNRDSKLLVYDALTNNKIKQVAQFKLKHPAHSFYVNENYCFLAAGKYGVAKLDINNLNEIIESTYFKTSGTANKVVVKDNYAYIADGPSGLTVLDISKPGTITFFGSNNKLGEVSHIAVQQSRMFAFNNDNKLTQLDISRPEKPSILSSLQLSDKIQKISYSGKTAIVTLSNNIQIIDFSAETPPAINTEGVTLGGSRRAVIDNNNIMYVADWFSGLHIYDVSDPRNIKHLANYHTKGSSKGVVIKDGHAFVGDDDHGLQIINIQDPSNPVWVSEIDTPGLAYTMEIVDNILYLADHRGGFQIIDISDFKQPKRLGMIDTPGKAWAIDIDTHADKKIAYIADDLSGLLIYDVSVAQNPKLIGQFKPGGFAEDVKIRNGKAFITFFDSGLYILDITSPASPILLSHITIPGNARGIELDNDIAYVSAWYAGIQIIDIKNTSSPKIIGYYDTDGATWGTTKGTAKTGHPLYALDWWGGIKSVDVSDNYHPTLISRYHAKNKINNLEIKGNYAYTTNGHSGLQVFDIRNSLNPMWVTALELPGEVNSISIRNQYAYLTSKNKIYIINIVTPFKQKLIGTLKLANEIKKLKLYKNFAYILNKNGNLLTYDISTTVKPTLISETKINASDLWVNDNLLVTANNKNELRIYTIKKNGQPVLSVKHSAKNSIDVINIFKDMLFVYSKNAKLIYTLSKTTDGYKETASTKIDDTILDMKISNGILYTTNDQSRFITYVINNTQLQFSNVYPATNRIEKFQVDKGRVFFAGNNLLSTLILMPEIVSKNFDSDKISVNIPKSMPLGIYDLLLLEDENIIHKSTNSVSVKLPNFQKPQFK